MPPSYESRVGQLPVICLLVGVTTIGDQGDRSQFSHSTTTCNQKCTGLYSKSINITHAGSKVRVHIINNNGSKFSLKVKLLHASFLFDKCMIVFFSNHFALPTQTFQILSRSFGENRLRDKFRNGKPGFEASSVLSW